MTLTNPQIINLSTDTTFTVDFNNLVDTVFITGSNTSVNVIGTTGTANDYSAVTFMYAGTVTGDGQVQIFGRTMPSQLRSTPHVIECYYFNSTWYVNFSANAASTGFITNANVAANAAIAFSKMATLGANRIPQINSSGVLEASGVDITYLALLGALTVTAPQINNVAATTATTANLNRIAGGSWTQTDLQNISGSIGNFQAQINSIIASGSALSSRILIIANGFCFKAPANTGNVPETNDYLLTFVDGSWSFTQVE